jgi:hypothetical protein
MDLKQEEAQKAADDLVEWFGKLDLNHLHPRVYLRVSFASFM